MSRLAPSTTGVASVHERSLLVYADDARDVTAEHDLGKPAEAVARFGDEWLVRLEKQKQLARVGSGGAAGAFAAGKSVIAAFGVGRDDTVVVARGDALELWSRDGERRWSCKAACPLTHCALARDYVVCLGDDGALYFFGRDKGEALGALRLASVDAPTDWRLAHVDGNVVVLALGEWLVWIDAVTRKTVRRVRARSKVRELAADADLVVVAVEEGFIQAFRAASGEPRASISAHDGGDEVTGIALGPTALFSTSRAGGSAVRTFDRQSLDVAVRASSPVCCIGTRGRLAAVGDRSGRIRVLASSDGELREIGAIAGVEGAVGVYVAGDETITIAGQRVLMRVQPPYANPRPIALRTPPTAFAADESYAFVGTQTGAVDVYELASGRPVTTYALSSDDRVTSIARLPGAHLVVGTGALDGRVLIVDVAEAKVVHRLSPHEEAFGITSLAADPRGRIVATGSDDGRIALLDPVKGRVLAHIRVNETPVALAFEPTGRRLACVFADGTASIVTFAQKGATVSDLGLRGATQVAWGESLLFGFKDGHAESGERHAMPSDRPAARQ